MIRVLIITILLKKSNDRSDEILIEMQMLHYYSTSYNLVLFEPHEDVHGYEKIILNGCVLLQFTTSMP